MNIDHSVALVTGAGSGLGLGTCRSLLEAGARVVAVDRDEQRLHEHVLPLGPEVRIRKVDVTQEDEIAAAAGLAVEAFGGLHIAINCAGILGPCKTLSRGRLFPLELWNMVIAVNLTGTFNVIRHAALAMTANTPNADGERGVIVNTSSGAAWQGQVGQAAYSASKAGVMGLTLPVARDLAVHGIRVVTLAPGLFETAMTADMPPGLSQQMVDEGVVFPRRKGQAPEFAALVRHVIENTYVNATTINIDGGIRT